MQSEIATPYDAMIDQLGYLMRWTWFAKEKALTDSTTLVWPRFMVEPSANFDSRPVFVSGDDIENWELNREMVRSVLIDVLDELMMYEESQALRQIQDKTAGE